MIRRPTTNKRGYITMANKFSRSQILKASGAFIAGAAATKTLPLLSDSPAQAQTGCQTSLCAKSGGNFNSPQVSILQTNANNFARLRFQTGSRPLWDIAIGGSSNLMNFFTQSAGNVMSLTTGGNVGIGTTGPIAKLDVASGGNFNSPQVQITQTNPSDSPRLRFRRIDSASDLFWDISFEENGFGSSTFNVLKFGFVTTAGPGSNVLNVMQLFDNGDIFIAGSIQQSSSRELKENIAELSSQEAVETLKNLSPVKYNYKANREEQHIGFIAEDVPELVATPDRKGLSSMDIVGVLTKVVQEQQQTILALAEKVKALEEHKAVS